MDLLFQENRLLLFLKTGRSGRIVLISASHQTARLACVCDKPTRHANDEQKKGHRKMANHVENGPTLPPSSRENEGLGPFTLIVFILQAASLLAAV
ncbi:hypothetical protein [Citrobacter sedlakii]|uniref:hypothetical protein n=1 Tax=Citrobacter sedlakii TaxID=67826 RepID=UPI003B43984C